MENTTTNIDQSVQDFRKPESVVEVVANFLRKSIVDATLKPGEKIQSNLIAQNLGVSIIPFREAVRILEKEGLINSHRGRGSWVANTSRKDLQETFEMREMMELAAVTLIERHCESNEIELLAPSKDVEEIHCLTFHRNLIRLAGNSKLTYTYDILLNNIIRYQIISSRIRQMSGISLEQHFEEHFEIYEALMKRDFEATRKKIAAHLSNLKNTLLKQLQLLG
jgi:DNA-binding GntR family transcriptional regulator